MILHGDSLILMKDISDKSIDLIIADSPYNIRKDEWDKWKKESDYINWCLEWIKECERVLKDNGSFYFFHNDMEVVAQLIVKIKSETKFVFKQMIVWNKRFAEASNKGFLDGFVVVDGLRNYQKMCEYCLFYTFQDETGLSTVMLDTNNFPTSRKYFKEMIEFIGQSKTDIMGAVGQQADHCFRWKSSQWDMPTEETYNELIKAFGIDEWGGFQQYESLRQQYESLRYTFNNQKTHHSIWNYEIAPRVDHVTPKPLPLIENIIKHSSNEGDLVMDPFLGSGTTAIACKKLKRRCIGIEKEEKYIKLAERRMVEEL